MSEQKPKKESSDADAAQRWDDCDLEAQYFGDHLRQSRQERKQLSAKDRSKYKKTDSEKRDKRAKEAFNPEDLKRKGYSRGRVTSILSQGIVVHAEGRDHLCELRGVLKKERTRQKNICVVGDFVWFEELGRSEGIIQAVEPRETVLMRADNLSRHLQHLLAANIHQVLITSSVVRPLLKPSLIDRYIIATRRGGMTPVILINKIDLLQTSDDEIVGEQQQLLEDVLNAYEPSGIRVLPVSSTTGEGLDKLRRQMEGTSSVFSGQSGTGKTSLINAMLDLDLPTGKTVQKTRKGAHTTTSANLLPLVGGGWCVDTPGIKSFGVWDLQPDDVEAYFNEIHATGHGCKFSDCSHTHEEDCAVKAAIEEGEISTLRYDSYVALREESITGSRPR